MNESLKIIYILGLGHSGSTLLDLMLGSHSRIESGGEIGKYHSFIMSSETDSVKEKYCTCGLNMSDCEYWKSVKSNLTRTLGRYDIELNGTNNAIFTNYNYSVIKNILEVSKKDIFCDSSKNRNRLLQYLKSPKFNIHIVHLVRDGRAVAYSNKRKKRSYIKWIFAWKISTLKTLTMLIGKKYTRIRYEDLVKDPKGQIECILSKVNCEYEEQQLSFYNHNHHNIGGNRMRRNRNQVIEQDVDYLYKLTNLEWFLGSAITCLPLVFFGYRLSRSDELNKLKTNSGV